MPEWQQQPIFGLAGSRMRITSQLIGLSGANCRDLAPTMRGRALWTVPLAGLLADHIFHCRPIIPV
jgi:hypothetical protein